MRSELAGFRFEARNREVWLDGRRIQDWSARERAHRMAYVPQVHAGTFGFSVEDVVMMGRTARGSISADSMSVGIPFGGNLQFRTMRRSRFVTQAMKSASERGSGGASLNLSRI